MEEYIPIAQIPNLRGGYLTVSRRKDRMYIGGRELDLEGMAQLVMAVDECVRQIREAGNA
jgi:hypothetical protein